MKRIRILFLLFALSTSGLIQAQQQPSGTIRLSVADSLSQPVDAAFVQLLRARDSSLVQTGLTEADGKLEFTALPLQTYFMVITHLGNRTLHTRPIELSESTMLADLGTLQLQTTMLKEVVVEAKTPFIEKLSDRLVVNVGSSSLNAGSNTLEVLQHSPGVKVDGNDNISLKGKQNVMVMIDGKTTMMSGTDLANYLRGLSAGSVDKIELITNPSAKYDASGNAGIINIRLKKDKRSGTNGSVSAGFGQGVFSRTAEGFNINHRTDKFNVFLSYNYSYRKALNDLTLYRQFYAGSAFNGAYSQHNYIVIPYSSHNVRTGLDFFLNDKTTLGLAVTGMSNRFSPYGQNTSAVIDSLQRSQSSFNTINHTQDNHYNVAINLNARHLIDTAGRELSADLDYAHYVNQSNQDFTTNYYALDNTLLRSPDILSGNLRGMLDIYSVKADYTHPLSKEAKLEAGIKSSYVKADNDLKYYSLQNNEMQYDTSKSNHFIYTENINAAYTNFSGNFNKTKVQAGLRIEQTIASGNQLSTGQKFTLDYAQLFPSLAFNRRITANQELGITLSRRIDRPTYGQLNPFRFYLDPSTIKEGNPYLLAQYTYGAELSDVIREKYILTLGYSSTQNAITTMLIPSSTEKKVMILIDENMSRFNYFGLNISAPLNPTKWWSITNNGNLYYGQYVANLSQTPLNSGKVAFDINSNSTFTINKKLSAEMLAVYNSASIFGYLTVKPTWQLSVGMQCKVLKDKGNLKLSLSDIFWTMVDRGTTVLSNYNESFSVKRDTRMLYLSFTYNFGSSYQQGQRKKTGGAEEEKRRAS